MLGSCTHGPLAHALPLSSAHELHSCHCAAVGAKAMTSKPRFANWTLSTAAAPAAAPCAPVLQSAACRRRRRLQAAQRPGPRCSHLLQHDALGVGSAGEGLLPLGAQVRLLVVLVRPALVLAVQPQLAASAHTARLTCTRRHAGHRSQLGGAPGWHPGHRSLQAPPRGWRRG